MLRFIHDSHKPVYTIHVAAELLGCHPRTLRLYEAAGLVSPKRTASKYRLYSQHDLTMVKKACALMDEWDLTLSGARAMFKMAERFHIEIERMFAEMLS